jgi:hypothetical protein
MSGYNKCSAAIWMTFCSRWILWGTAKQILFIAELQQLRRSWRLLAAARVIEVETRETWAPVLQHPYETPLLQFEGTEGNSKPAVAAWITSAGLLTRV